MSTEGSKIELSVVIPAYNESNRLPGTLLDIKKYLAESGIVAEIIVVDDGSTDDMRDKVRLMQETFPELTLITYGENRGKGFATKTGMMATTGTYAVYMDADNSTNIREYPAFKAAMSDYSVAIASRYLPTSQMEIPSTFHRTLISRFSHFLIRNLLRLDIRDTQCGFKLFRREAIRPIFSKQTIERFGFDMELVVIAREQNLALIELPVRWVDSPDSRVDPIRDTWRTFTELLKIRSNWRKGLYA
jgi:dolichyl-phosphate beta-glucosyltransferase